MLQDSAIINMKHLLYKLSALYDLLHMHSDKPQTSHCIQPLILSLSCPQSHGACEYGILKAQGTTVENGSPDAQIKDTEDLVPLVSP